MDFLQETHIVKKTFRKGYLSHGLILSLHWQIPFLCLSRPPGLLAGFVSCKIQTQRIGRPVLSCNCSAMLAFVFISLLVPQLFGIKIRGSGRWTTRRWTASLSTTLQYFCVNCSFLELRIYLWRGYEKDTSIFIAKNAIVIWLGLFETKPNDKSVLVSYLHWVTTQSIVS